MIRSEPLLPGNVYHVMNKSIAGYEIFTNEREFKRMLWLIRYFSLGGSLPKFSQFLQLEAVQQKGFETFFIEFSENYDSSIYVLAYCIMPTHVHLIIEPKQEEAASHFMANIQNGYARYLNTSRERKGPLWVGPFKSVAVSTDEQLLHLSRYVHLNPVTGSLVRNPIDWVYSSYKEYLDRDYPKQHITHFQHRIDMPGSEYRNFVEEYADTQKELALLKKLTID